jgi:hypothetical protein
VLVRERADAVFIPPDAFFTSRRVQLVARFKQFEGTRIL